MRFRTIRLLLLLLVLVCVAVFAIKRRYFPAPLRDGVCSGSGESLQVNIPAPVFRQHDGRWGEERLGASKGTLENYGCTVCCLAMALSSKGFEIDPGELNRRLLELGGFTESGLIVWGSVPKLTKGGFEIVASNSPTARDIDGQLKAGNPVLAKVLFSNTIPHWVLVTGKRDRTYLINDPLGVSASVPMDGYPRGVFAIRFLQKRPQGPL